MIQIVKLEEVLLLEKLVLIDGNSIANRAFYALPPLTNAKGQYTNAVYGFTNMLLKILEEERPTYLLVAFDAGKVVFRHKEYEAYKGTRQKSPSELKEQFPLMKDVLDAFGIKRYELEGYEADDIIGTLSLQADQQGITTRVVTGDKDMLQLVSENVHVGLTRKGITEVEWFDMEGIREKWNLTPDQIRDLKGLMGDSSDNIPGIPGVGEKTALKFLQEYGTVEGLLANIDQLKGKVKEKVEENKDLAVLSKELATIHREVPIGIALNDLAYKGYSYEAIRPIFMELEFRSLMERIQPEKAESIPQPTQEISYRVACEANLKELEKYLTTEISIHVEIDGENYHRSEIIAISLGTKEEILIVPVDLATKWEAFQSWLTDETQHKWTYDGKRVIVALNRLGLQMNGITFDLLIGAYLLNPSAPDYSLASTSEAIGGFQIPSDEEVYGKGAKRKLPVGEFLDQHLARKAKAILETKEAMEKQLEENELRNLFLELELPLSFVLANMEIQGVKVDRERLLEIGENLEQKLNLLTEEIYQLAGATFNINSTKQLGEILFERLGLPPVKKTKTGYSTDAETLEKLQDKHEIIGKLLDYRTLGKLKSTYVEGLTKEINDQDGKIHTIFNQSIAATGRLSSTDPNLQNIPIRIEEGRRIRQVFIPSEIDWYMFAADYSQIELRILAHLSRDKNLMEAFQRDMDIHTRTAMDVFGVNEDQVTANMRRQAKAVNFGIVYGISDYGLSQNLGITRKEAAAFIDRYFSIFAGVKTYMEESIQFARKHGYVTTLLNRRRYLPDILHRNFNLRSFAERTAMNTPIQGTAADIIKKAMVEMEAHLKANNLSSRMLLQVHDELVFEVPAEEIEEMKRIVPEVMENALQLDVPLKVDVSFGPTWYEAK